MSQARPPRWDDQRFERDRQFAIQQFRKIRMREPLEQYLATFVQHRLAVETLLEVTEDLFRLSELATEVLTDPVRLQAVRYLAGPAISQDDLKVLAEASLAPGRLRADEEMARRVIDTVLLGLDRSRFPWIAEGRQPTEAERQAAIVATAALMAGRRMMTDRANESKAEQEDSVAVALEAAGFSRVATRTIDNLSQAPGKGEFCGESSFGGRKADIVAGLWDGRAMPIECKVSNSSTNSVKRLNNDAAQKATIWLKRFGDRGIVPAAVISGVFKLGNLKSAQDEELTIFWAHDLAALIDFIESTR